MSILKAFNNHLLEFIDDLIVIFPEDLDIRTSKTFVKGIIKVNPKMISKYYYENIAVTYKNQIENADISFFINKDYNEDLGEDWKTNKIKATMDRWRNVLKNTKTENKNKAMKYFQNLSKLAEIYYNS
jgi:hypothetical protein|tara:strand:+ start:17 stop:400 length:384 start_codon:yes stop_codon:yes gene_type:complete